MTQTFLSGQTALVTGAGRGIGAAIALRLAKAGARVACLDIDPAAASRSAEEITKAGRAATPIIADVSSFDEMEAIYERLPTDWRQLDILVASAAAITQPAPVASLSPDVWSRTISVTLTGVFNTVKFALPHIGEGGRIVLVASQLGSVATPGRAPYCAAKGGVLQLARVLALELAPRSIRVNTLSPGPTWTDRLNQFYEDRDAAEADFQAAVPLGRLADPEEMAQAALLLADPGNGFMTGADLVVDGGYLAR